MRVNINLNLNSEGSQITDVQYLPNFKRWFKDSKVVEDGKPKVVYHGSTRTFEAFDLSKISDRTLMNQQGPGFYFTDKKNASQYLKGSNEYGAGQTSSADSKLYAVYLSIKRPLYITGRTSTITLDQAIMLYLKGDNQWFYSNWIPFTLNGTIIDGKLYSKAELESLPNQDKVLAYAAYLHEHNGKEGDTQILSNLVRAYKDKRLMFKQMKKVLKADGIVYKDHYGFIYVCWSPNQIKSLDNVGTFDASNSIVS